LKLVEVITVILAALVGADGAIVVFAEMGTVVFA
jgi:hypothetical protein